MASFTERISVIIDVTTNKAVSGLKDFRQAVGEAEGFTGKLKAGVGSLKGVFAGSVAGPLALGTAVATAGKFALDAVNDYATLGVQIGDFSAVTGLAVEDASRWIEVAGDLGVEADTLQSTLGKLNKSIDPKLFDNLGVAIARTSSGAVDAAGTFENVLQKLRDIKDPTERAQVGAKLLGKSWQSVAPLIARSAQDIKEQLQGVDDVKVFDAKKVKQSQEYKKSMEDFKDAVDKLTAALARDLLPTATATAGPLADLATKVGDFNRATGGTPLQGFNDLLDMLGITGDDAGDAIQYTGKSITNLGDSAGYATRAAGLLADQQKRIADHTYIAKDSLDDARTALKKYQDQIKGRNDLIDLVTELDDISTKLNGITMLHAANQISDREYWLQSAQLTGDAQVAVSDYIDTLNTLPPNVKKKLLLEFDPNAPDKFLRDLQAELDRRKVTVGVVPRYVTGPQDGPDTGPRNTTPSTRTPTPKAATEFGRNAAQPVNITVNVPPNANLVDIGRATADALAAFYRAGGERV